MAVAQLSTTSLNKLFLEYIKPGLEKQFYLNTTVYDRFKGHVETGLGKYAVVKVLTANAKSARPSSSSTFPTAQQESYSEFLVYAKRGMYASLQFDGLALACGKGAGAVKDLVKSGTESIVDHISHKLNKQYWGDGSGRLAILAAAVSNSTTATVDGDTTNWGLFGIDSNGYTAPSRYLFEGQTVDVYNSSGVLEAEDVEISTLSEGGAGTDTLTMASAITCSANSFMFDHDTYASTEAAGTGVPMGLIGIISSSNPYIGITASSAFQGVNRSTYSWAQAQVFNMGSAITSPAVLTTSKILEVIQKCERYGTINVIITNDVVWRALFELWEADKTMPNPNDRIYWGGTSGLTFYAGKKKAIPIIFDEDCPDGKMFFIDDSSIKVVSPDKSGLDWLPGDNGNILMRVQGKDEFVANLRSYYNLSTNKPKANGLLRYIKHASS